MRYLVELYPYEVDDLVLYIAKLCGGRLRCVSRATYILFLTQYRLVKNRVVLRYQYGDYPVSMAQFTIDGGRVFSAEVLVSMDVLKDRMVGGCPEVRCGAEKGCKEAVKAVPAPVRKHIMNSIERLCTMSRPELSRLVRKTIGVSGEALKEECEGADVEYCIEAVAGRKIVPVNIG